MEEVKLAAREGDIDAFYKILEREPSILKNIDEIEFVETPLHTAASSGCTDFAIEMLRLRPSFGSKQDPRGYCPLDLALRSGHRDTVKQLIMVDPKLIQVRSREGKTPLHYVAEINDADLLIEFLVACPTAIKELTIRGETVVHLAVRSRSIQAFKVLFGWLDRTENKKILGWKDKNGFTVLHIAAQTGQVEDFISHVQTPTNTTMKHDDYQVAKILTKEKVYLNVRNQENKTALDIVEDRISDHRGPDEVVSNATITSERNNSQNHSALCVESNHEYVKMQEILHRAGAMKTSEFRGTPITMMDLLTKSNKSGIMYRWMAKEHVDMQKGLTMDMRHAYLVVTVLIVTASFQAVISPPGGGWQNNDDNNNNNNTALVIMPPPTSNTTIKYSKSSIQKGYAQKKFFFTHF